MKNIILLASFLLIFNNVMYTAETPKEETAQEKRLRELMEKAVELEKLPQNTLEQITQSLSYTELKRLIDSSPLLRYRLKSEFEGRKLADYWRTGQVIEEKQPGSAGARIKSLAFSPDAAVVASAMDSDFIELFKPANKDFAKLQLSGTVMAVAFTPDGKLLTFEIKQGKNIVRFRDMRGKEIRTNFLPTFDHVVSCAAFSIDGKYLALGSNKPSLATRIFDIQKNRAIKTISFHYDVISSLAISPDGTRLAAVGNMPLKESEIVLVNAKTGDEIRKIADIMHTPLSVAFSPDGTILATGWASSKREAIQLIKTQSGEKIKTIVTAFPFSVAFSRDGKQLVAGFDNGEIEVFKIVQKK